jgi:hypothetical protein
MNGQLTRYDAMCRAIVESHSVDEVKPIRDKALALEMYARQAKNTEAEQQACEIRLRAERRAGELLTRMDKAKGALKRGNGAPIRRSDDPTTETLEDLGISKQQSSDWQKLADVPQEQFDAALSDKTTKPTTAGIIRANAEPKPSPVSADA